MAGGVILDAAARGDTVTVVIMTNGDLYGVSTGYLRMRETVAGMTYLGLSDEQVVFLGYGDQSLLPISRLSSDTAVYTSAAGVTETYADQGLGYADYHRYRTGTSAAYTRANLAGDIDAILLAMRPTDVYVTSLWDDHPDHRATNILVTQSLVRLKRQGYGFVTRVHEGIVHAPCEYCDSNYHWPMPSFTPTTPFPMPPYLDTTPLVWAQFESVPVPPPMQNPDPSLNTKYQGISRYPSQLHSNWLFAFVKSNEVFWPVDVSNNVAPLASVTVSSVEPGTGASGAAAADGLVGGSPRDPSLEWASNRELAGATITLTWPSPQVVSSVVLYDRPNLTDNILAGTLTFSDGSTMPVPALPNNGAGLLLSFGAKTVTWVLFRVDSAVGLNAGLAEFQALTPGTGTPPPANVPPQIASGPTADPSSITDLQASTVSVTADDADGDPLAYWWTTTGGAVTGSGASVAYRPPVVTSATSFGVTVTVTDGRGGYATGTVTVYVSPHTAANIAPSSVVTVSSENTSTGQLGIKAVDGVISGYPNDYKREWATVGQLAGAWITLTWSAPQTVSSVVLYDRPNLTDNIQSGTLLFSDGSSVGLGALPNSGVGLTVEFDARTVSWVKFLVDTAVGSNIGLAEIEVYGPDSGGPVTAVGDPETERPAGARTLELRLRSANPTHGGARFEVTVPRGGHLRVAVYDVHGGTVAVLCSGPVPAGVRTLAWNAIDPDGRPVSQGVYYVQARVDGEPTRRSRVVVLRS